MNHMLNLNNSTSICHTARVWVMMLSVVAIVICANSVPMARASPLPCNGIYSITTKALEPMVPVNSGLGTRIL